MSRRPRVLPAVAATWQGMAVERPSTPLPALGAAPGASARLRIFSAAAGQQRFRRATDVFLLVPSLLGLVALIVAYPPSRFERELDDFLQTLPGPLDPVWVAFYELLGLWALALVALALVMRRHAVWLPALAALAIAGAISLVSARIAQAQWPDLADSVLKADVESFPVLRVALCAALILAVGPHLVRPLERAGRWIIVLGTIGAILSEDAPVSASLAATVVAVVAATVTRLALGTSAGHPSPDDVLSALRELGIPIEALQPTARQAAGVFVARGTDVDGRMLLVKVYGRDAYDTHLLERLWRTVMYRGDGPRLRLSRLDAVEHEALVTLLAAQAGVATNEVVIAAESSSGDALLVFHERSQAATVSADWSSDRRLTQSWQALSLLATANIAHNRIDPETVGVIGDEVGFVALERGTIAPRPDQLLMDRAQLLATTAALAGSEPAVTSAREVIGQEGLASVLPYLQWAAFGPTLRRALRAAEIDVDDLRRQASEAAGVELAEPLKLRRVTWWSVAQVALLALAVSTLVGGLTGLDHASFRSYLQEAAWGWIAFGLVLAQLPRVTQAIATLGSVPAKLPFLPVYVMQLATGYMNLALPSNLARMAINIRFFQRQGIAPTTAVTAGAIDSFASTVIQALLLLLLLVLSAGTLDFHLETPGGPSVRALVALVVVVLLAVVALTLVRRVRQGIVERIRLWWPDIRATLGALRSGSKLTLLIGGSLATEILFAIALGVFAEAFGYDVSLADLLLINISVSLLASFVPVPGGIGVAEFGLTVGLVAAGLPDEVALVIAILYRTATFYIPPLWGFFAMRWLRETDRL